MLKCVCFPKRRREKKTSSDKGRKGSKSSSNGTVPKSTGVLEEKNSNNNNNNNINNNNKNDNDNTTSGSPLAKDSQVPVHQNGDVAKGGIKQVPHIPPPPTVKTTETACEVGCCSGEQSDKENDRKDVKEKGACDVKVDISITITAPDSETEAESDVAADVHPEAGIPVKELTSSEDVDKNVTTEIYDPVDAAPATANGHVKVVNCPSVEIDIPTNAPAAAEVTLDCALSTVNCDADITTDLNSEIDEVKDIPVALISDTLREESSMIPVTCDIDTLDSAVDVPDCTTSFEACSSSGTVTASHAVEIEIDSDSGLDREEDDIVPVVIEDKLVQLQDLVNHYIYDENIDGDRDNGNYGTHDNNNIVELRIPMVEATAIENGHVPECTTSSYVNSSVVIEVNDVDDNANHAKTSNRVKIEVCENDIIPVLTKDKPVQFIMDIPSDDESVSTDDDNETNKNNNNKDNNIFGGNGADNNDIDIIISEVKETTVETNHADVCITSSVVNPPIVTEDTDEVFDDNIEYSKCNGTEDDDKAVLEKLLSMHSDSDNEGNVDELGDKDVVLERLLSLIEPDGGTRSST